MLRGAPTSVDVQEPGRCALMARDPVTATTLLDALLEAADEPRAEHVELPGADPVLPSRLLLGEAGAATIAAAAVQAARLWQDRGGEPQRISVAVDAAAAAMRSARYLRAVAPGPARPARTGGLGLYQTRDERWMYYQRLFPHHRTRLTQLLECTDDDDGLRAATARWDAAALEDAVFAAGASGAYARTADEWTAHPQAAALRELPLFEIERVGDAPPEPFSPAARPLEGIRVLDLTRVLAGPTAARTLAEHGADVLRIGTSSLPDNEQMMRDTGHGKRSAALDLTLTEPLARLRGLLAEADVFIQGYRPGSLAARGLGLTEVVQLRPGIIYVTLSAFGHTGPWAGRRGFDSVVQAANGIAWESARDGVPRFAPANPLDYMTGYLAAFGTLVALRRRAREGGSYLVRVSLAQTGRWLTELPRVDAAAAAAGPADLPAARLDELFMTSETPFGELRHLAPAAQLTVTPARWERPTVPLDHDAPAWSEPAATQLESRALGQSA
jgi:crotonobetainyl-CoA:carnitine CoA-transferase CaiB-like acyl-CoA transferase